jgi:hypothetical protein
MVTNPSAKLPVPKLRPSGRPYILTALITRPKRLVYLSSVLHQDGDPSLNDLTWADRPWLGRQAYSDTKLHDVLLAFAIARRWPSALSNALEPGWGPTRMGGSSATDDLDHAHRTQVWLAVSDDPADHAALAKTLPNKAVYLSSIGAEPNSGLGLITSSHLLEQTLGNLPIAHAFLRAGWFMENHAWDVTTAKSVGRIFSHLYPLDRRFSLVATADIGKTGADVFRQEWTGTRYRRSA